MISFVSGGTKNNVDSSNSKQQQIAARKLGGLEIMSRDEFGGPFLKNVKIAVADRARFQNTRPLNICLQNLLLQSCRHQNLHTALVFKSCYRSPAVSQSSGALDLWRSNVAGYFCLQNLLPQSCSHQNSHTALDFKSCYRSPALSHSSKLTGSLSEAKTIKAKQKRGKCVCFSFFKCTLQKR